MANGYLELMEQIDLFVDESGWTSMEPEGTDPHHHHLGGWPSIPHAFDRWEGRTYQEPIPERGPSPAEGDGYGAPE
ncbi:MAG: hypothetical protein JWO30_1405 [Fibrobacteres bacterium]|nr:hypothetical protein [Fibrobacterota bacterium]